MPEGKKLTLSDRQWSEFTVDDIFYISQGRKWVTKTEIEENPGNIPLVSCAGTNNGIMGYINPNGIDKCSVEENVLTIAVSGTAGATFYQGDKTAINSGVLILKGKEFTSKYVYLYMCAIVGKACEKFSYGMKASQDRVKPLEIKLPTTPDGLPDYDFMENYIKQLYDDFADRVCVCVYTKPVEENTDISLSDREWKEFQLQQLFVINQGKGKIDKDTVVSEKIGYPIATASTVNNGILGFSEEQNAKIRSKGAITIGRQTGVAFYQNDDFYETDNILILENKNIKLEAGLFIVSVFNDSIASKFSYGRVASIGKVKEEIISLPVTPEGQPDYDFMEQYIKSLPFSKALEI